MTNEQTTRLLQDLVRIPSVNPHGDPGVGSDNTGERRIADYLRDFLNRLALDVELHEVEPGRPNVIGKFQSRGGKHSVTLAPHTDTVSVAGMTIEPFGGDMRDNRVYGRGATDTKGSLAAMLSALANVVRDRQFREGDLDVYLCALMGEESGSDGARAMAGKGFVTDFVMAGEPTGCRIVYTHKGSCWFKVITSGRSCHASMPDQGENAIGKMAEVVRELLGPYRATLPAGDPSVLGPATVSVGVIQGGSQANIVPDYCEIEVDRRMLPGENHERILCDLRNRLKPWIKDIETGRNLPPMCTDPSNPFVQRLARSCAALDEPRRSPERCLTGAPWFCDAAIFAERGIPSVAFGPGNVAQAHTADEFIELEQVFKAARIIEHFLRNG